MKIRYIGVGAYDEQSVTGNFALWQPDQVSDVSTSDAAKLVAAGRFIYDDESTWEGQRLAGIPRAILHTGLPMILPPSSSVGNNGALTFGTFPAGSLSFAATSGASVVVTGTGTSFASSDVGRVIVVDGGKRATITVYTSATSVTVTISGGTLSTTTFANNAWQLATPMPVTLPSCYMYFPQAAIHETNMLTYSDDFSNAEWIPIGAIKTSTNNSDPFGTTKALLLTSDTSTGSHMLTAPSISNVSGVTYTQSVYLKAGTVNRAQLTFSSATHGTGQYANFSLTGGGSVLASAGGTASITSVGSGWYRCTWISTAIATASSSGLAVVFINSDTAPRLPSYTGTATDTLYVAAAQCSPGAAEIAYAATTTAAAGSAAGMYYVSMSSTVSGTIYNNTYTGGDPVIPATPTPFVTTWPGVFTQTTGIDITVLGGITVPGGSLGKNGVLRAVMYLSGPSNANTKNNYVYFGGINIFGQSTTTSSFIVVRNELINQGSESANISNNWLSSGGTATYPYFNRTINTAVDQTLSFACRITNANDYAMLNGVLAETIYGA